jgi:cytochrome c-type biogenesis protein
MKIKPIDSNKLTRRHSRFTLSKISPKWAIFSGILVIGFLLAFLLSGKISGAIEHTISLAENRYQQWLEQQDTASPFMLILLAFIGGTIASISPCILALLPINLSYIGTREITSRRDALTKAGLFVFGNIVILSLFGLVSSFAGAVMVEYRGHIHLVVGTIILVMGLGLLGLIKIPLPQTDFNITSFGPFGIGLTFALVSSPCSSPVLLSVLAAAGASGSQSLAVATMVSYACGYTMIIFLASLLTGFAKQARSLLKYSEAIAKIGGVATILAGIYYLITGVQWF